MCQGPQLFTFNSLVMIGFCSKFFGKNMGLINVFGRNFWPISQLFGQISTSEISKFEEILGQNPKIRFFFFSSVGGSRSKCQKIKKNFQS
jgi:hypothetical protein